MKESFQILKACGHTCPQETEPEVNSKIRALLPTQYNGAKAKKPDEKPEEKDSSKKVSSGKIKPLLNIAKY